MNDDRMAEELLLRDTIDITITVDAAAARNTPDETIERVVGKEACERIRAILEEED